MCGALLSQGARTEYPESGMSISTVPTETGDFWLVRAQCAGLRSAGARSNVTAVVFFQQALFFLWRQAGRGRVLDRVGELGAVK
mmetsp:Transcript_29715/g.65309  ORF Transcript_29715/g.65309 Transcript_29715/m.65309 type:complete len:84 (+) Transcript_29715:1284-1535(+)